MWEAKRVWMGHFLFPSYISYFLYTHSAYARLMLFDKLFYFALSWQLKQYWLWNLAIPFTFFFLHLCVCLHSLMPCVVQFLFCLFTFIPIIFSHYLLSFFLTYRPLLITANDFQTLLQHAALPLFLNTVTALINCSPLLLQLPQNTKHTHILSLWGPSTNIIINSANDSGVHLTLILSSIT